MFRIVFFFKNTNYMLHSRGAGLPCILFKQPLQKCMLGCTALNAVLFLTVGGRNAKWLLIVRCILCGCRWRHRNDFSYSYSVVTYASANLHMDGREIIRNFTLHANLLQTVTIGSKSNELLEVFVLTGFQCRFW